MISNKVVTIIAGMPEDLVFAHACYIASNLSEMLPNFHFHKICKKKGLWEPWLHQICKKYKWSHTKSPLIWREVALRHGNATYIGGASEFWEFIYEYYGIDSCLTKDELKDLKLDILEAYEVENMIASSKIKQKPHCLTIIGAGRSLCPDLVAQLVLIKELWLHCGVIIKLYDDSGHFFKLKEIVKDTSAIGGGLCATTIAQSMSKALEDSDIILVLDHLIREDNESSQSWLNRNRMVTIKLADEINKKASPDLKVIYCSTGPTCFCAAVLLEAAPKLKKTNIVAVSAHYGLEILHSLTEPLDLPLREFYCPPVWGFLGVNQYVDIWHIIQQHEVYKPNNRLFKFSKDSTLPLGTKHTEYRWSFYMAHDANPYGILSARRAKASYLVGRTEDYQKCKAICDLLQLWYDHENDTGDDIISLGICSDGTFDIPKNIFFSQPVYLKTLQDKSRIWVPCEDFPMPNHPPWMFRGLIATAETISQQMIYSKESTTF